MSGPLLREFKDRTLSARVGDAFAWACAAVTIVAALARARAR